MWKSYQARFNYFKAKKPVIGQVLGNQIPWPIRSELFVDVIASDVADFFEKAVPKHESMANVMKNFVRNGIRI